MASKQLNEEAIFHVARDIANKQSRSAYLDQICAGDQALRDRVEALLDVHEKEQSFLQSSGPVAPTIEHVQVTEQLGQEIGRYKLLQKIGEGGFGVVYMAEQSRPVRRKVALKIIKPGMDTRAVVARFEAERQALALMDHPNIARVLDGGATDSGRPYFVMELVKGLSIVEFCDKKHLNSKQRLMLFIDVCRAVQHAHQKGIIHRDLKPSNVMVTLHDGKPVVKVIDFGVSKAINQQLTEKTLFTNYGQMIGTPQYMSPEQAEMSGLDIDTRSDIYSLGVLLFELLTGSTPILAERIKQVGMAEMRKLICQEEPPRPTQRLSATTEKNLSDIAEHRGVSPQRLKQDLKGDLEWIIMKTLEKERERRYATALELVSDLERYLGHAPVIARAPSLRYRCQKYVRRNRVPILVVSTVFLALAATTIASWRERKISMEKEQEALRNGAIIAQQIDAKETALELANERATALEQQLYEFHVVQAAAAAREQNHFLVRFHLDRCPPTLRSWEWRRLDAFASSSRVVTVPGGERPLFANDGSVLITVGGSRLNIWDAMSGKPIDQLSVGNQKLITNAIHPNGRWIAVANANHELSVIDWTNGKTVVPFFQAHRSRIDGLEFTPDGSRIVSVDWGGAIKVWNSVSGDSEDERQHQGALRGVGFDPTGQTFTTASGLRGDGFVKVYKTDSLEQVKRIPSPGGSSSCSTFSNDGRFLAFGSSSGLVSLVDTKTWKVVDIWRCFAGKINTLCFSANDHQLAVSSAGSVKLFDIATKSILKQFTSHHTISYWLAFSPSGHQLAVFGWGEPGNPSTCIFDSAIDDESQLSLKGLATSHATVAYSPGGELVAAGGPDRILKIWDAQTGEEISTLHGHFSTVLSLAWSRDGKALYSQDLDGFLYAWDLDTKGHRWSKRIANPRAIGRLTRALAVSADGEKLYVAQQKGGTLVLATRDGEIMSAFDRDFPSAINGIACSPSGNLVAEAADDGSIVVWDALNAQKIYSDQFSDGGALGVSFSPNGEYLAASFVGGGVRLWYLEDLKREPLCLQMSSPAAWDLFFSEDTRRLLAVGSINEARAVVWDIVTGEKLYEWEDGELCYAMAMHPNGDAVVRSGNHGVVKLFFARSFDESVLKRRSVLSQATIALEETEHRAPNLIERNKLLLDNQSLDPNVRAEALRLQLVRGENPFAMSRRCWKILIDKREEDYEEGLQLARQASSLAPECFEYAFLLGRTLHCLGRCSEARPILEQCESLTPNDPRQDIWDLPFDLRTCLYATQAAVCLELGDRIAAEEKIKLATESFPGDANSDQRVTDILMEAVTLMEQSQAASGAEL